MSCKPEDHHFTGMFISVKGATSPTKGALICSKCGDRSFPKEALKEKGLHRSPRHYNQGGGR